MGFSTEIHMFDWDGAGKATAETAMMFSALQSATTKVVSTGILIFGSDGMDGAEVALLIRRFVGGTLGVWEWDDFVSVRLSDAKIDRIRMAALEVHQKYPPTQRGEYCNLDGTRALLELADEAEGLSARGSTGL